MTLADAEAVAQRSAMRYDRDGDHHYDLLSALQKSIRGSDPDAAVHYLARLLEAGDLISACRRLMVIACEDVGLAYPQIIPIVKACVDAANMLGMPEARIPLGDAAVRMATSPKSNSAHIAMDRALSDVRRGKGGDFPRHLQNVHADSYTMEREQGYLYPHDFPHHWVRQQYLPDGLVGRFTMNMVPTNWSRPQSVIGRKLKNRDGGAARRILPSVQAAHGAVVPQLRRNMAGIQFFQDRQFHFLLVRQNGADVYADQLTGGQAVVRLGKTG